MQVIEDMMQNVMILAYIMLLLPNFSTAFNVDTQFPVIYNNSRGSYFGYTVALNKNGFGPVVLVGAPRANTTVVRDKDCGLYRNPVSCEVHQPGALFRCELPSKISDVGTCSEVTLSTKGNIYKELGDEYSYYGKKDHMWLGVSLDSHQFTNEVVVCGHLWRNQIYTKNYLVNGICYVINRDLELKSVHKLVPLTVISKQTIERRKSTLYYYAFGQAGMSAIYSEDGKHLALGAPGLYNWHGSVVSYSIDSNELWAIYTNPSIPYHPVEVASDSYLGYSMASGRFFGNDLYYAAGAPRDGRNYGRVYIFKASEMNKNRLSVHQRKEGTQFGEYFGASVLGINLNDDTYTDLLVGAPFFSLDMEKDGDEGKVHVFISNGVGLEKYAELVGDSKPNARFGTSIANAGDLNQDGYNDVAIGAPYQDGKGAVYIYHGTRYGMNDQYTQKIEAKKINADLLGFGIHISKGVDVDNNKYPDILIGAYASSHAVLFRTRPVVRFHPMLKFSPNQISTNLTECEFEGEKLSCINVTACLWYSGNHVPKSLDIENDISVVIPSETHLFKPRGFFVQDGVPVSSITESTKLLFLVNECINHQLYIYSDIVDMITPIEILYSYQLASPSVSNQNFPEMFPINDRSTSTDITSAIPFQTGCGQEDKCFSDLVVSAEILHKAGSGKLTLGEISSIYLPIKVQNKGEPAYMSELLIYLPPDISSTYQDICSRSSQRHNASLVCGLGNPLTNGKDISITLDISKIQASRKKLEIVIVAVTASTENTPADNNVTLHLDVQAIADVGVSGIYSHEQILYDEATDSNTFIISHTYTIKNYGPSSVGIVDIKIDVPTAFIKSGNRMEFLTLRKLDSDSGKQLTISAQCNDTNLKLKSVIPNFKDGEQTFETDGLLGLGNETRTITKQQIDSDKSNQKQSDFKLDSSTGNSFRRSKRSLENRKETYPEAQEEVVINCKRKNVECVTIRCSATPFTDLRKVAQITISAEVNMTTFSKHLGSWYRVELVTIGTVSMRDKVIQNRMKHPDIAQIGTVFVWKGPRVVKLAAWVIFVSVGVGVLLLIIILILLIRFGFFRRKEKENLKKMLEEENNVNKECDPQNCQEEDNDDLTEKQED